MSFASKHNKGAVDWGIDTKNFEYFKLEDLYNMDQGIDDPIELKGLFITSGEKSEYGKSIVAILADKLVNLPQHMLDDVQDILQSDEDVADIKSGKVGFYIRTYQSDKKKGKDKTCYSITWTDLD